LVKTLRHALTSDGSASGPLARALDLLSGYSAWALIAFQCEVLEAKAAASDAIDLDCYGQLTIALAVPSQRIGLQFEIAFVGGHKSVPPWM
jgi:hypothetical protein